MGFTNSKLVTYTKISPNKDSPRNHIIDTITIHCYVGQVTAESGCNARHFVNYDYNNGASCNYVVGYDGSIGLCVDEKDRSWCSSSGINDNRAITIEVACEPYEPYKVTDKAMSALINLVTDICKRNNIKKLKWSTNKYERINHTNGCNMTVHRDFANKSCPGEYLYNKHTYIALEVNKKLKKTKSKVPDIAKPYLEKGSEGIEVAYLQQDLNYLGFKDAKGNKLDTDGIFGAGTEHALKVFQKKYGLTIDGEYGNNSYNKMKQVCVEPKVAEPKIVEVKKKVPTIAKPYLEQGNSNTQVKYLQQDLNYLGFKDNNNKALVVDGIFGAATAQALKKFQKKYKLTIDAEYGNASYEKMKKACK